MPDYTVLVSGEGTVFTTRDADLAWTQFLRWVECSMLDTTRVAGASVFLMHGEEIVEEYNDEEQE